MDMRRVPFFDAHVHFCDLTRLRYPWLTPPFRDDGPNGSVEAIARDYRPADYRAELAGWTLDGAVHVDAGADPADAIAETAWLDEQAGSTGLPNAVVAFVDLAASDVDAALARQAAHPRVRGIRQIVNWHADPRRSYSARDLTRDDDWVAGFAALARHGFSFDLQCYPTQMGAVARIAAANPDVPIAINHLGMPILDDPDGIGEWRRGLASLAALPQASIKLSGLGFARRDWDADLAVPLIREVVDVFGPARAMAASDLPTDRLFATADCALATLAAAIAPLADAERRAIWGGNARRFYRIDTHQPEQMP